MPARSIIASLLAWALAACASPPAPIDGPPPGPTAGGDPSQGVVPLSAQVGWEAFLALDNQPTGVWTVDSFPVFPQYGCPEVVGLDDQGRCHVLVSYSGKWTPTTVAHDGKWLGGLAHGDVDPRVAGAELYVGGQKGNLYQVVAWPSGALDCRRIAEIPGREIHTLVAGDLDPSRAGVELLGFTSPGALYLVRPSGEHGTFELELLQELPGRVRDAKLLPADGGAPQQIATVSRAGRLALLRLGPAGPEWTTVHEAAMGMGRLAVRPPGPGRELVLYTTLDDGRILRHERKPSGEWVSAAIYLGPQGPRGIAAGRFDADAEVETVAIFGYSGAVELLSRRPDGWRAETIFVDRDKGHWLAAAELDGRNATQELLASGYGARIVVLARPPGYGRSELTAGQ